MNLLLKLLAVLVFTGPAVSLAQKAELPAQSVFNAGDTWVWRQIDNRTTLEEGKRSRTVAKVDGTLMFSDGTSNTQISQAFIGEPNSKPWRVWPLEVGTKWAYDGDWVRADGMRGNTKQDAEVVAYEEVTVPAEKFMAFKINYRGFYWNSRSNGKQHDTYWYAPDANADVKHVRDDGSNMYTRELTLYKRGSP